MSAPRYAQSRRLSGGIATWIRDAPAPLIAAAVALCLALLGVLDYVTGPELAFSMFYLLPLSAVAWRLSLPVSAVFAVVAAVVWQGADILSGETFSSALIPLWNTTARLLVFLLIIGLVAKLRDALAAQTRLASIDSLTQIANPRSFAREASRVMGDARAKRRPLSVAYIDLDNFKEINDTLGHSGGDHVLRVMATALSERTRASDVIGRLGGDEFALVLPETSSSEACRVMEGLTQRLDDTFSGLTVLVTFSAGVVTFVSIPDSVDDLLRPADALMYEAKSGGKGTYLHATIGAEHPAAIPDQPTPRAATRARI